MHSYNASHEHPVYSVRGVICAIQTEATAERPVFQILAEDGSVTEPAAWPATAAPLPFSVGRRVIWTYMEVPATSPERDVAHALKRTTGLWIGETMRLYRPVGPRELELIVESGFNAFPPRLPEQPIFYPVLSHAYAAQIASEWNVKESGRGYVTTFEIEKTYLDRYVPQQAGSRHHQEYWIPAEELTAFNARIIGKVEVVASYPK